jgi:hypothetical protein
VARLEDRKEYSREEENVRVDPHLNDKGPSTCKMFSTANGDAIVITELAQEHTEAQKHTETHR